MALVTITNLGGSIRIEDTRNTPEDTDVVVLKEGLVLSEFGDVCRLEFTNGIFFDCLFSDAEVFNFDSGSTPTDGEDFYDLLFSVLATYSASGGGSGTVTSVGLALNPAPSSPAIQINNSPITTSGGIEIEFLGTTNQLVLGNGSLGTIQSIAKATSLYIEDYFLAGNVINSVEYVSSENKLYVAHQTSSNVLIFDATTGEQLANVGFTNALKVRYIPLTNEVWVTSSTLSTIRRIDASTNTVISDITTGVTNNGYDILYYDSTKVFITCALGSGVIMVINPTTALWVANVTGSVPTFPFSMALNTKVGSLQFDKIVVSSNNGIAILDPSTNAITTSVANPSSAISGGRAISFSPTLDKYYVASTTNSRVVELAIATATTFTATILHNQSSASDLLIDDTNDLLFVFNNPGLQFSARMHKLSTLEPIMSLPINASSVTAIAGYGCIDLPNKRIFAGGRTSQPAQVFILRYL